MLFISVTFVVRWGNIISIGFNYSLHVKISFFSHMYLTTEYLFLGVTKRSYMHCRFLQGELCSIVSFYPCLIIYKNTHIIFFPSIRKLTFREMKWFSGAPMLARWSRNLDALVSLWFCNLRLKDLQKDENLKITRCNGECRKSMCPSKPQLSLLSDDVLHSFGRFILS